MHASRKNFVRKITLAGLSLGVAVQACDSSEEKLTAAQIAEHCALDSDCDKDLVCVFEHCHVECNDDVDCDKYGSRCVRVPADDAEKSTTIGVCQLPDEATCSTSEECKGKQVCAEDEQCRDQCSSKAPCFSWLSCSNSGECAAQTELDSNGDLIVGSGGAGNAGAGQTGGKNAGGSGGTHVSTGGVATGATGAGGGTGGTSNPGGSGEGGEGGSTGATNTGGSSQANGGTSSGGGTSNSGGASNSGGTSSTGGNVSQAGNTSLGGGGAGGAASGEGGEAGTGTGGDVYVEETNATETVANNDRDHTLPLPKQGSLWLPTGDQDWFYIDVPNDGRAHVIELLMQAAAGERAYVAAFAAEDKSPIGNQVLLPEGTTRSVFVTVGSGTRSFISFTCDRPGRLDFELIGVTAERDEYEPNNDRETAKPVELNTDIIGQQIVPYTSLGGIDVSDWFQVTLAAGSVVLNVVDVPANVGLSITMMDSLNNVSTPKKWLPGVIGSSLPIAVAKGVYRFQVTDHSNSGLSPFYSGPKPESLDKTYTIRFEQ